MKLSSHLKIPVSLAVIPLATVFLSGCGDSGPSGPNLVQQDLGESENSFKLVETSAERFRYQTVPSQPEGSSEGSGGAPDIGLTYTVPEGWEEASGSSMRDVNLSFGDEGEGECYVARLPGMGGGLLANVNRWRQQMGADPITEEEAAALPTKPLFGQDATFISVDGDFAGMSGGAGKKDYRLLGLILASDAGAVFVKMTGPRELVEANTDGFDLFTSSLDIGQ